ncbi:MAG: hypothetical protein GYB31_12315 [Bacteroidetes bacterium]|nr:hypothetical protein [Bacteroidota bacterium]
MNSENFSDFIEQPSHLYQIPYEELKSLVLQYPYCQNLRYLLLKKSKIENHREYDKNLHMAATFSPDRTFLFNQIKKTVVTQEKEEAYELNEDFLELRDLNEVRNAMADFQEESEKIKVPKEESLVIDPGPSVPDEGIPSAGSDKYDAPFDFSDDEIEEEPEEIPKSSQQDNTLDPPAPPTEIPLTALMGDILPSIGEVIDWVAMSQIQIEEEQLSQEVPSPTEEPRVSLTDLLADILPAMEALPGAIPDFPEPPLEAQSQVEEAPDEQQDEDTQEESNPAPPIAEPVELEITNVPEDEDEDEEIIEQQEKQVESGPKPTPKASFSSWLKQFQSPQVSVQMDKVMETEKLQKKKKKKKKKKVKDPAKELAIQSVQEQGVASETLASILAQQGHYSKALQMYKQLKAENPDKADYFQKMIDGLKR